MAASLEAKRHLLVQAGTGTGKSLAYLAPALLVDGPVVVSTPAVWPCSGWPGVLLPHVRSARRSSSGF